MISNLLEAGYSQNHIFGTSAFRVSFALWHFLLTLHSTATVALMLDSLFGIFNNVSPRFQWAEIDLTFPSDDGFFSIASYEKLTAHSLLPARKMKIKDAFLVLFSPDEKLEEGLSFLRSGGLTALDMQMLIHCLFTILATSVINFIC
jgi:hypothetical protein